MPLGYVRDNQRHSGRRPVDKHEFSSENCHFLCYFATSSGNFLPTFRDKPSVPSKKERRLFVFLTLEMGAIGCTETSVMNYYCLLLNNPEERSSDLLRGRSLKSHMNFSYFPSVFMIIRHFVCSPHVINL